MQVLNTMKNHRSMFIRPTVNSLIAALSFLIFISDNMAVETHPFDPHQSLIDISDIVFAVRLKYDDPHWYANIGYYCDDENKMAYAGNGAPDIGKLCKLNLETGQIIELLNDPGGSVRDPQIHYDAKRVLFSYRKSGSHYYNLYEINLDGTNLRQITSGPYDDYEPAYLPDGDIIFVSTRCNCWVNCWTTQVGVLYRCQIDGQNIQRLSYNTEHDNTPWVLPDGRILYTRWEYIDRSQVAYHHLWTMNPDGTQQMIYYGNMHPRIVMIDAKPIPNSDKVLACFSPGHGVTDHKGFATIVSAANGPDDIPSARELHKRPFLEDPYPLSEEYLLAARAKQIIIMDDQGHTKSLFHWPGDGDVREPRPVIRRQREKILSSRIDPNEEHGTFILTDVRFGRNMNHPKINDIKKLLILEVLPKPVNFSGGMDMTSWLGTFTLERVLGTVPVEEDGSAYFKIPANRPVFFVALDKNDLSVKRMQSFTSVMPGEAVGCIGCHEPRNTTLITQRNLLAVQRAPSTIKPFEEFPDVLDFQRDIQPILDKHCIKCHNPQNPNGHAILTGDLGPTWSHSYFSLLAQNQVGDGRNGLGNQPPCSLGSSASPLLGKLSGNHHDVKATKKEWRTVWLWTESGAPYAGSYAALRNVKDQQVSGIARFHALGKERDVLRRRCSQCHELDDLTREDGMTLPFRPEFRQNNRGLDRPTATYERVVLANDPLARFSDNILINFTRPHLSPLLLAPLSKEHGGNGVCGEVFLDTEDSDYQKLLEGIQKGKQELDKKPRYGNPDFQPNKQYIREMKKYGVLPASYIISEKPLDVFETDKAYWKLFHYNHTQ
jgi:hypothetical protein